MRSRSLSKRRHYRGRTESQAPTSGLSDSITNVAQEYPVTIMSDAGTRRKGKKQEQTSAAKRQRKLKGKGHAKTDQEPTATEPGPTAPDPDDPDDPKPRVAFPFESWGGHAEPQSKQSNTREATDKEWMREADWVLEQMRVKGLEMDSIQRIKKEIEELQDELVLLKAAKDDPWTLDLPMSIRNDPEFPLAREGLIGRDTESIDELEKLLHSKTEELGDLVLKVRTDVQGSFY